MSEPTTQAGRDFLGDVRVSALPGSQTHDLAKRYVAAIEDQAYRIGFADGARAARSFQPDSRNPRSPGGPDV